MRLQDAAVLESALETPVPVRFIFILIGPTTTDMDYHECGRAMAALLADKVRELTGRANLPSMQRYLGRSMQTAPFNSYVTSVYFKESILS